MENEVIKAIRERRSIRRFTNEQIKDNELQTILEAGTWAPTGKGLQDPWIVAVQNKQLCNQLRTMNATIMGVSSDPYYGAPTLILVFASKDWYNNTRDGSLVLANMMLAAHAIGLGSCWINREDEMFATAEGKLLMQEWGLPEGLIGIGALAVGYPASWPKKVKERKKDYYRIVK